MSRKIGELFFLDFFLVRPEFRERKMREIVSEFFKCVFGEKRKLKG